MTQQSGPVCTECNGSGKVESERNIDGCDVPVISYCIECDGTGRLHASNENTQEATCR